MNNVEFAKLPLPKKEMEEILTEILSPETKPNIGPNDPGQRNQATALSQAPDPPPARPTPGLKTTCCKCGQAELNDPYIMAQGLAMSEKLKHLKKLAQFLGWTYEENDMGDSLDYSFICTACIHGKYKAKAKCPKCGSPKINTKFCKGYNCPLGISSPHLHRTCTRCEFMWAQWPLNP